MNQLTIAVAAVGKEVPVVRERDGEGEGELLRVLLREEVPRSRRFDEILAREAVRTTVRFHSSFFIPISLFSAARLLLLYKLSILPGFYSLRPSETTHNQKIPPS